MDFEMKVALGRLLAQGYKIQNRLDGRKTHEASVIYGLQHGIEDVIDEELLSAGISSEKCDALTNILTEIWNEPAKMAAFQGYYDIERDITAAGINRGEAMVLLTYLKAHSRFTDLINKMDTSRSPSECRTFKISDYDL